MLYEAWVKKKSLNMTLFSCFVQKHVVAQFVQYILAIPVNRTGLRKAVFIVAKGRPRVAEIGKTASI